MSYPLPVIGGPCHGQTVEVGSLVLWTVNLPSSSAVDAALGATYPYRLRTIIVDDPDPNISHQFAVYLPENGDQLEAVIEIGNIVWCVNWMAGRLV